MRSLLSHSPASIQRNYRNVCIKNSNHFLMRHVLHEGKNSHKKKKSISGHYSNNVVRSSSRETCKGRWRYVFVLDHLQSSGSRVMAGSELDGVCLFFYIKIFLHQKTSCCRFSTNNLASLSFPVCFQNLLAF